MIQKKRQDHTNQRSFITEALVRHGTRKIKHSVSPSSNRTTARNRGRLASEVEATRAVILQIFADKAIEIRSAFHFVWCFSFNVFKVKVRAYSIYEGVHNISTKFR